MKVLTLLCLLAAPALPLATASAQQRGAPGSLTAIGSDRELSDFLRRLADTREDHRLAEERRSREAAGCSDAVRISRGRSSLAAVTGTAPPAVIRGRVTIVKGSSVTPARVVVRTLGISTTGAGDGRFRLSLPPERLVPSPRRVTLVALLDGYEPLQRTLVVSPGDSVEVTLPMCPAVVRVSGAVPAPPAAAGPGGTASVTNVQVQGVDEGGIVKVAGDYLVILRRGRLFTVALGAARLTPVAALDAFGPGIDPAGAWYDEMLVSGDKVVVIGYSYRRGGTELGVFRIDQAGGLRHLATYQLRSNDYYSSRNYASRLVGGRLVFYTPLSLAVEPDDPSAVLPSLRRWDPGAGGGRFVPIASPQRVYLPRPVSASADPDALALHTVTTCDLAAAELRCEATVVVGPSDRAFHVSVAAVYVWMSDWRGRGGEAAMLVRLPLDGSAPGAIGVFGSPVDQFSFFESSEGRLNVLVRSESRGDGMWNAERVHGNAALLRIPPAGFGDGSGTALATWYRPLPAPAGWELQNRFVGDHLLYGAGGGWQRPEQDSAILYVTRLAGESVDSVTLPHGVDRIEAMGADAVVIGANGPDLLFSGVQLGERPVVRQRYTMEGASQGETRSHGFYYRADGPNAGTLGLPVAGADRPGLAQLSQGSASVLFLRNTGHRFERMGVLSARGDSHPDDGCRASCADWYGNARPLFLRGRVFALLGYELVEGAVQGGGLREVRRISFSPPPERR